MIDKAAKLTKTATQGEISDEIKEILGIMTDKTVKPRSGDPGLDREIDNIGDKTIYRMKLLTIDFLRYYQIL